VHQQEAPSLSRPKILLLANWAPRLQCHGQHDVSWDLHTERAQSSAVDEGLATLHHYLHGAKVPQHLQIPRGSSVSCLNAPSTDGPHEGVCHICAMRERLPDILRFLVGPRGREKQSISFCPRCCHWFCDECWEKVMGRLTGFMEEFVSGAPAGCCGPKEA